ncbi:MAG: hypothetical protein LBC53_09785 [Spirochaetaceae bacterium]|jgi:hypothetical protein|nr:hypothetical protein [Spirochaetaceae bacterium]
MINRKNTAVNNFFSNFIFTNCLRVYWTYFANLVGRRPSLAKCGRFAFLSGSWLNQTQAWQSNPGLVIKPKLGNQAKA